MMKDAVFFSDRNATRAGRRFGPAAALALAALAAPGALAEPSHGISMHGAPALKPGASLPYANPEAPKGGDIVYGEAGSFDSVHPFIVKGQTLWWGTLRDMCFESLLTRNQDEPFALYGLLAESVETPDDRSWVEFALRPEAKFSDGSPVTVEDVIFSMETLRDKGRPTPFSSYKKIAKVEKTGERKVKFTLGEPDRELPLLMGLMPIMSKKFWEGKDFEASGLTPILGSGAYVIDKVDPGVSMTFKRNPDYWGKELPINKGINNFDTVKYLFFKDANAVWEAFKTGLVMQRRETDAQRWAREYDFPAVKAGDIVKGELTHGRPTGMHGLVFNTRRPLFADRRVREALSLAFDFEWMNKTMQEGAFQRIQSYFANSPLGCDKAPADDKEKALLAPFAAELPEGALEKACAQPASDGSGRDRANLRKAADLLKAAGWAVKDGALLNEKGEAFAFEILTSGPEEERTAGAFVKNLETLGVKASLRTVDSAQMTKRKNDFDYDMTFNRWTLSLSPGNEQRGYWGAKAADTPGSRNYMGVKSPAVDAMVDALLNAREIQDFQAAARALDRALTNGVYVIPLWWTPTDRFAWTKNLKKPEKTALYGYRPEVWWSEGPQKP